MFGGGKAVDHAELGELRRRRGAWRGEVELSGDGSVDVVIPGGRSGPDADAAARVVATLADYPRLRPVVAAALADHHPDDDVSELPESAIPTPSYVAAIELDGEPAVELGYEVPWDDEHTLGARFQGHRLIELNGSVLAP